MMKTEELQQIELFGRAELAPIREPAHEPEYEDDPHDLPRRPGRRLLGLGAFLLLSGAVGIGAWRHYEAHAAVMTTAQQLRDFVPTVQTAAVRASDPTISVSWPGSTEAFATANIYARASGYILKRNVDIGSRVKQGDVLVEITAPELDRQITQAEATLAQTQAALQQAQANRDLASVTWRRDSTLVKQGWVTLQQGDTDRLNLQAQEAAVAVADANATAQQAQISVLRQQKAYQSVNAPFDGVITQRNVDIGSLVQADAASGTFMFTLMNDDVMRVELYVPQDEAFGVKPGVEALLRVPEMPGRSFPGTVTRIADALQPGTRTLQTEIDVPNPDHLLKPGVYCTVELKIPRMAPSLIVPAQAIIFNGSGLSVAVVDHGVARIRQISERRDFGSNVEVDAGLSAGDQVIINPPIDLADGHKVEARVLSQP